MIMCDMYPISLIITIIIIMTDYIVIVTEMLHVITTMPLTGV